MATRQAGNGLNSTVEVDNQINEAQLLEFPRSAPLHFSVKTTEDHMHTCTMLSACKRTMYRFAHMA